MSTRRLAATVTYSIFLQHSHHAFSWFMFMGQRKVWVIVLNKTLLPSCDTATVLCHWEDMSTSEMIIQLSADANHGSTDILCTPMNDDVDLLLCFHAKVYLQVITCTERIQRAPFIEGALKSHCALWSCKVLGWNCCEFITRSITIFCTPEYEQRGNWNMIM